MADSVLDEKLARQDRSDRAAAAVLMRLLDSVEANFPGAVSGSDADSLHDFRVAIRRTRAVQRELKSVFAAEPLHHFRAEFRWLQRSTGEARDLDVYVLEFDDFRNQLHEQVRPDLDPLLAVLRKRRAQAWQEMVEAASSKRTQLLLSAWRKFLAELENSPERAGPCAADPIGQVAGHRISKVYRRMVRDGSAISHESPPEDYHELRKQGKELRYLLELFGKPLYPKQVVKPMVRTLKALQDTLGRHQDREVQIATVRSLIDPVSAMPDSAQTLIAMELLIERLADDAGRARAEFAGRFGAFASSSQRKLVKETFT